MSTPGRDPAWMEAAHADYLAWSETPPSTPGAVQMGEIVSWLRERLPPETVITNGAGNYAIWVHVCFAGDGCFQMTMQDFTTAVQYGVSIIVIVVDNGQYGTIRMHQTRRFPDRDCSTRLRNPDFAAFAEACGGAAFRVERTEDFFSAFEAAERAGRPALIHVKIAPEALGPGITA